MATLQTICQLAPSHTKLTQLEQIRH